MHRYLLLSALVLVLAVAPSRPGHSQGVLDKIKDEVDDVIDDTSDAALSYAEAKAALDRLSGEQNCRGRWGIDCWDAFTGAKNPTTVEHPCDGDDSLICVTSKMTIGSIKHDICCDAHNSQKEGGHWCWSKNPKEKDDAGDNVCKDEWNQALTDWDNKKFFTYTWRYTVGDTGQQVSANWWVGLAPDGLRVSQKDPDRDKIFCKSNEVVKKRGKWVCAESTAVASNSPSTSSHSAGASLPAAETPAANPDSVVEVYGLRIGMTPSEVRNELISRHPDLAKQSEAEGDRSSRLNRRVNAYPSGPLIQKSERCFLDNSRECIGAIEATIPGNDGRSSYKIEVSFVEELPARGEGSFAYRIRFAHNYEYLSFDPLEFATSKYGEPGERMASQGRYHQQMGPARVYRDAPLTVTFAYEPGRKADFYQIVAGWYVRDHQKLLEDAKRDASPKADEPF